MQLARSLEVRDNNTKKITLSFRKTPTDLTIGEGYLKVTPGEPCVTGKREHAMRRRLLLKKFSAPTSGIVCGKSSTSKYHFHFELNVDPLFVWSWKLRNRR